MRNGSLDSAKPPQFLVDLFTNLLNDLLAYAKVSVNYLALQTRSYPIDLILIKPHIRG